MTWSAERTARMGLCSLAAHASPELAALVAEHGPEEVWQAARRSGAESGFLARARRVVVEDLIAATLRLGARFVIPGDDEWPSQLGQLDVIEPVGHMVGAPCGLWVQGPGRLGEWSAESVAVVGSRACTEYGSMVAGDLAYELADERLAIVSGGAYGIDAAAHGGALAAQGRTIAVLANGVDEVYPKGNRALLERVIEAGLIVTELAPGERPTKPGFLARNRIIAALSLGTVVVEATARSGARNTATWTAMLGRSVMAVPGPVTSACSETPHRLIRDGEATLVASSADVRAVVAPTGLAPILPCGGPERPLDALSGTELAVRECLPGRGTRSAGEVAVLTGLDLPACLTALSQLECKELIEATPDGRWKLRRPRERT